MMDFQQLDQVLRDSVADLRLSNEERVELRELGGGLEPDRIRFLRNRAFALVRELAAEPENVLPALKWLEQVVKTLDSAQVNDVQVASAHFSPGESCRRRILDLCNQVRDSLSICVFTISDDRLSRAVLACHQRGVKVRIISDHEKQHDMGSDIAMLRDEGIPLRVDPGPYHMHHKFALFDERLLLNGSFNWTRSASDYNQENLLVIDHAPLVADYVREFEDLWERVAV